MQVSTETGLSVVWSVRSRVLSSLKHPSGVGLDEGGGVVLAATL